MSELFEPGDFALLRQPLLTRAMFDEWASAADFEAFVLKAFESPWMDEALYLTSASLHTRLGELRGGQGDVAEFPSERKKLIASLAKFLSRAAFRCTPFGLFAQVQHARLVDAADATEASPEANADEVRLHRGIHLDAGLESRLVEQLLAVPAVRESVPWFVSTTIYSAGDSASYVDWVYQDGRARVYRAVELELSEAVAFLKDHCQAAQPFGAIQTQLAQALEVDEADAREFLHGAIEQRLLLPDLTPTSPTACSLERLLDRVGPCAASEALAGIHGQLLVLRQQAGSTGSLVPAYEALRSRVDAALAGETVGRDVLQVDTLNAAPASIDRSRAQHVARVAQQLFAASARAMNPLDDYKRRFRDRFEDREVNFAYAMHEELGVPFPAKGKFASALADGVYWAPAGGVRDAGSERSPAALDRIVMKRWAEALKTSAHQIELTAEELAEAATASPATGRLAEAVYAQVAVLPTGGEPGDAAFELKGLGGNSGVELLARFCHLSPALQADVAAFTQAARPRSEGTLYAEIIHHPQDRLLNILRRPRVYDHDLVFAGTSELPRDQQIWISDLTIQLRGNRFVLRDRRSGQQVVPRLTSAHNYGHNQLGVYQFLATLQDDGAPWSGFSWPLAVRDLPFLPRVSSGGVVFSRARWLFDKADIQALNSAMAKGGDAPARWQQQHQLPRFVTWDLGDNHLPVDFNNPASVSLLLDEVIKLPQMVLHECLSLNQAASAQAWAQRNEEWLLPLRVASAEPPKPPAAVFAPSNAERERWAALQGDAPVCPSLAQWCYLRVYVGAGYSDRVLRDHIGPVLLPAQATGAISTWFFVRFNDGSEHLRVRFKAESSTKLLHTLAALQAQLDQARAHGLVWRVLMDDYRPELDRYGGEAAMAVCERLFGLDTEDQLSLLRIESQHGTVAKRWLFALVSLDAYLDTLALPPGDGADAAYSLQRSAWLNRMADGFIQEHGALNNAKLAIGGRFRELRQDIDALDAAAPPSDLTHALAQWRQQLAAQAQARTAAVAELREVLQQTHATPAQQDEVFSALVHMHANRFLHADPRRQEAMLYDFLRRLDRAKQGKQKTRAAAQLDGRGA